MAMLVVLKRNKIEVHERAFQSFCIGLSLSGISEADIKLLHSELKSCEKYVFHESLNYIYLLNFELVFLIINFFK